MNAKQVAQRFGCTIEQARALYRKNAATLRKLADRLDESRAAGKARHSGYATTREQAQALRRTADKFEAL